MWSPKIKTQVSKPQAEKSKEPVQTVLEPTNSQSEESATNTYVGTTLPSVQRSVRSLQKAGSSKNRQMVMRTLQNNYGNAYVAKVASSYKNKATTNTPVPGQITQIQRLGGDDDKITTGGKGEKGSGQQPDQSMLMAQLMAQAKMNQIKQQASQMPLMLTWEPQFKPDFEEASRLNRPKLPKLPIIIPALEPPPLLLTDKPWAEIEQHRKHIREISTFDKSSLAKTPTSKSQDAIELKPILEWFRDRLVDLKMSGLYTDEVQSVHWSLKPLLKQSESVNPAQMTNIKETYTTVKAALETQLRQCATQRSQAKNKLKPLTSQTNTQLKLSTPNTTKAARLLAQCTGSTFIQALCPTALGELTTAEGSLRGTHTTFIGLGNLVKNLLTTILRTPNADLQTLTGLNAQADTLKQNFDTAKLALDTHLPTIKEWEKRFGRANDVLVLLHPLNPVQQTSLVTQLALELDETIKMIEVFSPANATEFYNLVTALNPLNGTQIRQLRVNLGRPTCTSFLGLVNTLTPLNGTQFSQLHNALAKPTLVKLLELKNQLNPLTPLQIHQMITVDLNGLEGLKIIKMFDHLRPANDGTQIEQWVTNQLTNGLTPIEMEAMTAQVGVSATARGMPDEIKAKILRLAGIKKWSASRVVTLNGLLKAELKDGVTWVKITDWLERFATRAGGPVAGAGDNTTHTTFQINGVPGIMGNVNVVITNDRYAHVQNRHTFENFEFSNYNITQAGNPNLNYNSFFQPGTGCVAVITAIMNTGAGKNLVRDCRVAHDFKQTQATGAGANCTIGGTYTNGTSTFKVTQFYPDEGGGVIKIPRNVLRIFQNYI